MRRTATAGRAPLALLATLAILAGLLSTPAAAQVCLGTPPIEQARATVQAGGAVYTYADAYTVEVTAGAERFGRAAATWAYDEALAMSNYRLDMEGGWSGALYDRLGLSACPVVGVGLSAGPHDFLYRGDDIRTIHGRLGASVGAVALRWRAFTFVPFGGVDGRVVRASRPDRDREGRRHGVWGGHGVLTAGVGLVIADRVMIRPAVTAPFSLPDPYTIAVPFGREVREVSLGVDIGLTLAR